MAAAAEEEETEARNQKDGFKKGDDLEENIVKK